ncbi:MAG TPA: response regulator, partial [Bacteroidota bacterium]
VQLMSRNKPSLIVCDVNLSSPEISGFTFCERLKEGSYGESLKDTPFVIMSAVADDFFIKAARQLGSKAYLPKPFTREKLETVVRSALA